MKTIFWNVDTQYDFMRDDESFRGALPVSGAITIERNLAELTKLAEIERIQVINTADWHTKDSKELSDNPNLVDTFPPHCLQYTKGAEFIPATNPINPFRVDWQKSYLDLIGIAWNRNIVLYKDAFDIFTGNPHTEEAIKRINPDRAIVYGVTTNVCVDYAVKGLLERKIEVYVPIDAIKELPNLPLPYDDWARKGAILTRTNEVYEILKGRK